MNLNLCRLCYESEANINIFQGKEVETSVKINYCCRTVHVQENDGFPSVICRRCEAKLDDCYQFVLKCDAVDKKLRYLLYSSYSIKGSAINYYAEAEVKAELHYSDNDSNDADEPAEGLHVELKQENDIKSEKSHQPKLNLEKSKKRYKKRVKSKKEDLVCSVCSRQCLSSSALSIHMRTHTNERPFECPRCGKTYKDGGTLKRHIDRNHLEKRERKFICENCGKGFYSKCDVDIHMRVHTGETPYACPICSARFTQISAMLRHKRRHTDEKTHMCSTCSKSFWTKEELKKHFSVHEDVKKFTCPICQVQFKQKGSIQKHMRVHAEPNRFVCSHCGNTFNNKGNLKSHVERKHSEKSGFCQVCLKSVSDVDSHMWRHTGQRPFKCEFCTSSFYESKALALHINFKHKRTDKHKCTSEGCTKNFPSKPMLMYHVAKFHDNQTTYPCQRCSRGFYRKNDLARHMLGTHKEKLL